MSRDTECSECGKDTGFGLLCDDCSSAIMGIGQAAKPMTPDERSGMAWWNALAEIQRTYWLCEANTAIPAEAWAEYKRRHLNASPRVFQQDAASYDSGFKAGRSGLDVSACPHPAGCNESWSWTSGFIEGKARRLRAVK